MGEDIEAPRALKQWSWESSQSARLQTVDSSQTATLLIYASREHRGWGNSQGQVTYRVGLLEPGPLQLGDSRLKPPRGLSGLERGLLSDLGPERTGPDSTEGTSVSQCLLLIPTQKILSDQLMMSQRRRQGWGGCFNWTTRKYL
jgi:hypothetical protein